MPVNEQPLPEPVEVKDEVPVQAQEEAPIQAQEEAPVQTQEEVPIQAQPADEEQEPEVPVDEQPAVEPEENLDLDDNFDLEFSDEMLHMDSDQLDAELNDMLNIDPVPELQEKQPEIKLENDTDTEKVNDALDAIDSQYHHPDTKVSSFVHTHITNDLKSHFVEGTPFSTAECRFLLSSALLYHALCRESEEHTTETAGSLTDMLKNHPDIFTAVHLKLQQSYTVNAFLQAIPEGSTISMKAMNLLLEQAKNTPIDSVDLSADVLTSEQCTDLLTNEILKDMLRKERSMNQTDEPGALETMLAGGSRNAKEIMEDDADPAQITDEARAKRLKELMESNQSFAKTISDLVKHSDTMKELVSSASVDGQVSFHAVSELLKKVKDPDFIDKTPVLDSNKTDSVICEFLFDKAASLKDNKGNSILSPAKGGYSNEIRYELSFSKLFQTMKKNAGIDVAEKISPGDFTKLLAQTPTAEDILNAPLFSAEHCTQALAEDALDRMFKRERTCQRSEAPEVKDASTLPLAHLITFYPDAKKQLLKNMVASASSNSLRSKVEEQCLNKAENKVSLAGMATLIKSLDNLEYVNCDVYDENILDQKMGSMLISDYMLDNMVKMHRLTHEGEAGCLETLREKDPNGYNRLRYELSQSEEVRRILPKENEQPADKLSLAKLEKLFPKVKNANFCKCAVDKAIAAIKKENQKNDPQNQKDLEKNQVKAQKPVMPRGQ